MAHIGESRVLATHPIHTNTQQVLHLLLESAHDFSQGAGLRQMQRVAYTFPCACHVKDARLRRRQPGAVRP